MRERWAGWRLALRLGRREAMRARGRSILVLVMIALPVLGVTAADVLIRTANVNSAEGLDRRLGTVAAARVTVQAGVKWVQQGPDPDDASTTAMDDRSPMPTVGQVEAVLGRRPMLPYDTYDTEVRTDHGVASVSVTRTDLTNPLAAGLGRLVSGRLPAGPGEVAVNGALADRGMQVGETLAVPRRDGAADQTLTVVGIVESTTFRITPVVFGSDVTYLGHSPTVLVHGWLVGGGPVTWSRVRGLNRLGALVLSRAVVQDPPLEAVAAGPNIVGTPAVDKNLVAVVLLVFVMAVLEVVLLAGPAFAVGAKRQARDLALLAVSGGTPRQSRRVVQGTAVVLGGVGAILGVGLGIAVARLLQPLVQRASDFWFGPFEVPWPHLLGVAAFGLGSAFLAAVVPAWSASRQDVVAVLARRRADKRPSVRFPLLGLVLLGAGTGGAIWSIVHASQGVAIQIAVSTILCVFGMVLLVPVVVATVARLARWLPLTLRFAVRDAARHRTRTTPAVAAVAATVAGVVALGIAVASDQAQNAAEYHAQVPIGDGFVTVEATGAGHGVDWAHLRAQIADALPGVTATPVESIEAGNDYGLDVKVREPQGHRPRFGNNTIPFGPLMVSGGDLPAPVSADLSSATVASASRTLQRGGAVVLTSDPSFHSATRARIAVGRWNADGSRESWTRATVPATYVDVGHQIIPAYAVIAPSVAKTLGYTPAVQGVYLHGGTISDAQERDLTEELSAAATPGYLYVEHGYQATSSTRVIELVLFALGALLMLGGTLTATFLALADARPDLATLAAVGAAARTRRGIAAAYAFAVGLLGSVLGALVGVVPGIAITYPLTGGAWTPPGADAPSHYLSVPWLLILGVVLGLPAMVTGVVALTTRSRLPMVARLD